MNPILSVLEKEYAIGNSPDTDYKAEVIAAGLLEKGVPADQVCILRRGNSERSFSKDISAIRVEHLLQEKEYLAIYTNRQGFYDNLPERLFHPSSGAPFRKGKAEILEEMERHRTEEKKVREFFRPFEVAINSALVDIQLVERKIDKKQTNRNFVDMFGTFWPILKLLPLERAILCMEVIATLANLTPTLKFASELMSLLLDVPVNIRMTKSTVARLDRKYLPPLGKMRLGIDMILGDTFEDGNENLCICLGPMNEEKIRYYCKCREGCEILKHLQEMLLPADKISNVKFIPVRKEVHWILSEDRKQASLLGINTFLGNKKI